MNKYRCYAKVSGTKYLGIFSGKTKKEAKLKAEKNSSVSLCCQCSRECEDAEIENIVVEKEEASNIKEDAK